MNDVIIRKATLSDLPAIQDLNHGLFEHENQYEHALHMNWPYEDVGKNFLRRMIVEENAICMVAEKDKKIIGYINGAILSIDAVRPIQRIQLVNLFILDQWRHQKIGSQLTDAFMQWAKEKQVQKVIVIAKAANTQARNFYEKLQFKPYTIQYEKDI